VGTKYVEVKGKCLLQYMDDLKLIGRIEEELRNEL
jgi:hypothetical protein